ETVDVWAVRGGSRLMILLTNHALPRQPIAARQVRVVVGAAPEPRGVRLARIDEGHANPRAEWRRLGRPEYLRPADRGRKGEGRGEGSRLREEAPAWRYEGGGLSVELGLPPHGVAALTVEFAPELQEG